MHDAGCGTTEIHSAVTSQLKQQTKFPQANKLI